MIKEREKLVKQLSSIESQLEKLPEGKLIYSFNKTHYKWYQSIDHKKKYIHAGNRQLAEQLAFKRYLTLLRNDIKNKLKAINSYLQYYPTISQAEQLNHSAFRQLLVPYFKPDSASLENWMYAPFESNPQFPEQLIHQTASGKKVRSKSEALIDTLLYTNHIPFRYECELKLGEQILYPDFTILHPETKEKKFWEHFGMMDNPAYANKAILKLQTYTNNGIIPGIHLITTFETRKEPLNSEYVLQLITYHFL